MPSFLYSRFSFHTGLLLLLFGFNSTFPALAQEGCQVPLEEKASFKPPSPPEAPGRAFPVLPAVPTAEAGNPPTKEGKASLSWRQKALMLSLDKFKSTGPEASPLCRSFDSSYADTLSALLSSLEAAGLKVEVLRSAAGEILVSSGEPSLRIIFTAWEAPSGKTWLKAGLERGDKNSGEKLILSILDTTTDTITHRGKI